MPSSHEVPAQPRYLPRQSSTCACGVVHLLIHHSQNSASSRKLDLRDARRAASVQRAGARSTRAHGEVVQAGARQGPADAWPCTGGENRPCRRPRILHRGVARRRRAVCALLLHGGRCVRARARARVREHYILCCSRKCPLLRSCRARQRAANPAQAGTRGARTAAQRHGGAHGAARRGGMGQGTERKLLVRPVGRVDGAHLACPARHSFLSDSQLALGHVARLALKTSRLIMRVCARARAHARVHERQRIPQDEALPEHLPRPLRGRLLRVVHRALAH